MAISEIGVSFPDSTFGHESRFGIPFTVCTYSNVILEWNFCMFYWRLLYKLSIPVYSTSFETFSSLTTACLMRWRDSRQHTEHATSFSEWVMERYIHRPRMGCYFDQYINFHNCTAQWVPRSWIFRSSGRLLHIRQSQTSRRLAPKNSRCSLLG